MRLIVSDRQVIVGPTSVGFVHHESSVEDERDDRCGHRNGGIGSWRDGISRSFGDDELGRSFGYQVYVPREFTPTQTWPVVITLHGGESQGTDRLVPTVTGFGPAIRRDRSTFPAIVLFPQAVPRTSWVDARCRIS